MKEGPVVCRLQGDGSARPSHLTAVMQAKQIEEGPTSRQRLMQALDSLRASDPKRRQQETLEAQLANSPTDAQVYGSEGDP